jgi:phage baseplate assembly protein W
VSVSESLPVPPISSGEADFRGVGWSWPLALGDEGADGRIALARYEESIRQSILLILGTAPGERVMRPTFGCGAHDYVFGTRDTATAARISLAVREALLDWEPRIEVLEITTEPEGDAALIVRVGYRVRGTDTRFNLVYPYYLQHGAG